MDVTIKGIITAILPEQSGVSQKTGNAWRRAQYILEHEHGQYPRSIVFDVMGDDKINQMAIRQGEELVIHLNIDTREFNGRYFNNVECWKVERAGQQQPQQQYQQPYTAPVPQAAPQAAPQPYPGQAPMPQAAPQPQGQGQQPLPFK